MTRGAMFILGGHLIASIQTSCNLICLSINIYDKTLGSTQDGL